ncbi:DNA helicase UvrD [Candidatus Woesearchaeota archaeon]|nr:DNA helicase UvrD [Candidatus Woesearchaeota archaeon]
MISKMEYIADLHLHSKHSQACSRDLTLKNLEKWARVKGVNLLGTADFTHPEWFSELKRSLVENDGIYETISGFKFVLSSEISLVYSQGGKGRRNHLCLLAPSLEIVSQITDYLLKHGRVDYDGRPIFKIPCPDFVYELKKISKDIEVFPAHIWTPWFSTFGSKSGFDSMKECFKDQERNIFAIETGLSSDPPMNWRLSQLDRYTQLSNSDSHSYWPWRLGREATIFDLKRLTYKNLIKAIREKDGYKGTIEVDPNYGKYHIDGHRKCNFCSFPSQTKKLRGICPVCKKPLVLGVLGRVEELADRAEGYVPKSAAPFKTLLPLSDIIADMLGKAVNTKSVWSVYNKLVTEGRSEFDVLLKSSKDEIDKIEDGLGDIMIKNRLGQIKVFPGYDGDYGVSEINEAKYKEMKNRPEVKISNVQTGLDNFG